MATVIGVFAALSYKGTPYQIHGSEHITLDHIFNGTFNAHSGFVRWVPEGEFVHSLHRYFLIVELAGDGVFATSQHGEIALVDLKSNKTTKLVKMDDVKDVR